METSTKTITIADIDMVCDISNQYEFKALLSAEGAKCLKDATTGKCIFGFQSLVNGGTYEMMQAVGLPDVRDISLLNKEDVATLRTMSFDSSSGTPIPVKHVSLPQSLPKPTKTKHLFGFAQSLKKEKEYKLRRQYKQLSKASKSHKQGNELYMSGNYQEAIDSYEDALRIRREILGNRDKSVADLCNNIGNVLFDQEKLEEALKMYEQALNI